MKEQKRIGIGGIIVLVIAAAWLIGSFSEGDDDSGGSNDTPSFVDTDSDRVSDRPGSPEVYRRIASMTSCSLLQHEFDIAGDNADREQDAGNLATVPISYMNAADDRLRELGCYG